MRLNCPNCGTGYDVADGMIPAGGRHVQCTDCHTRWFVQGAARPMLSEEQIITRLEARSRPRPVPVPDPEPAEEAEPATRWSAEDLAGAFVWENHEERAAEAEDADEVAEPPRPSGVEAPPVGPPVAAPAATSPWKQGQPSPPATPPDARPRAALRRTSRIDLTADGIAEPAPAAPRSRFVLGLLLALGGFTLMGVVYGAHEAIAARLPTAAPALEAYAAAIDALRADVAARLGGAGDG
jgi:predicted Zn finger-like uncharacterized protein